MIEQWLERPGTLASEALLDLLDPAKGLRDCVELLLESLQSAVDLIEVPEHVLSPAGYSRCAGQPFVVLGRGISVVIASGRVRSSATMGPVLVTSRAQMTMTGRR